MERREYQASGTEYLDLVTLLLQAARRANPTGGVWEAADLQWWWRRDQHRNPARQTFWLDGSTPVGAAIFTDWGDRWECDPIGRDHDTSDVVEIVWPRMLRQIEALGDVSVEMIIRDDDPALIDAVTAAGFEVSGEIGVATWMPAPARPNVPPLPAGFQLRTANDDLARPHHMIPRSGEHVAQRLAECSLYQPELDLAVYAPDGELAGYGLFWADPVTGVGLVEPMRTELPYQGMGLGRHVLAAGLDRLAKRRCSRFKVSYVVGNEASRRLYLGAGFTADAVSRMYRRPR